MKSKLIWGITAVLAVANITAHASHLKINLVNTANNASVGYIDAIDTKKGLVLQPHLFGLTPGIHGIHIHQNPSCDNHGDAAGSHLDPNKTNKHLGPNANGHLGDLPALLVNKQGIADGLMLAPHLTTQELQGHSMIIHVGGDNYSDKPQPNGGGGARFACGVIQ